VAPVPLKLVVRAHPDLVSYLDTEGRDALQRLRTSLEVTISLQSTGGHAPREDFDIQVR
jgi:hypothetical protein